MSRFRFPLLALLAVVHGAALAQSVSLQGVLGTSALLMIDGAAPRSVASGATHQGVKVISAGGDQALVEIGGRRQTLRVGDAPASVGGSGRGAAGTRIVLTAGSGGHFTVQGAINGHAATFMVDTGATLVAIGAADARRMGLNYQGGQPGLANTANGVMPAWRITLATLRIGDVEVREVDAQVSAQPMPFVLLGNSFLNRFQMQRDNEQMVLERRY